MRDRPTLEMPKDPRSGPRSRSHAGPRHPHASFGWVGALRAPTYYEASHHQAKAVTPKLAQRAEADSPAANPVVKRVSLGPPPPGRTHRIAR
jgi:hypothetical protein